MIKITYGNINNLSQDPWAPEKNTLKAVENLTTASILLAMFDGLKEGDYIIVQKHEN